MIDIREHGGVYSDKSQGLSEIETNPGNPNKSIDFKVNGIRLITKDKVEPGDVLVGFAGYEKLPDGELEKSTSERLICQNEKDILTTENYYEIDNNKIIKHPKPPWVGVARDDYKGDFSPLGDYVNIGNSSRSYSYRKSGNRWVEISRLGFDLSNPNLHQRKQGNVTSMSYDGKVYIKHHDEDPFKIVSGLTLGLNDFIEIVNLTENEFTVFVADNKVYKKVTVNYKLENDGKFVVTSTIGNEGSDEKNYMVKYTSTGEYIEARAGLSNFDMSYHKIYRSASYVTPPSETHYKQCVLYYQSGDSSVKKTTIPLSYFKVDKDAVVLQTYYDERPMNYPRSQGFRAEQYHEDLTVTSSVPLNKVAIYSSGSPRSNFRIARPYLDGITHQLSEIPKVLFDFKVTDRIIKKVSTNDVTSNYDLVKCIPKSYDMSDKIFFLHSRVNDNTREPIIAERVVYAFTYNDLYSDDIIDKSTTYLPNIIVSKVYTEDGIKKCDGYVLI